MIKANIVSIATGKAKTYTVNNGSFQSAYKKDNFYNFIEVSQYGISTDTQVDKQFHGGIDKAIHIGSYTHFDKFKKQYGKELDRYAMGCNIFLDELDEESVCVGDIFTIGDIKIEVSQPRQPCFKINALFGKDTSRYIIKNNATGWYARVLQEGIIDINDDLILEKRVSNITIKQLNYYLHKPPTQPSVLEQIFHIKPLATAYKNDLKNAYSKLSKS